MKHIITAIVFTLGVLIASPVVSNAATTDKEKAFTDAYKKAFETKDEAGLKGFLYTKGADPEALEFYTMMMTSDMGGKITEIQLRDLSTDEVKKAMAVMPSPSGGNAKLPVTPTKKLVLKVQSGDANGTSTSSSESFVAEVDGKFVIPVPGPVK